MTETPDIPREVVAAASAVMLREIRKWPMPLTGGPQLGLFSGFTIEDLARLTLSTPEVAAWFEAQIRAKIADEIEQIEIASHVSSAVLFKNRAIAVARGSETETPE